jgi:DNA-binding MarR family transcriptional regulator
METNCHSALNSCLYFTANSLARTVNRLAEEAFMPTGMAPSYAFVLMIANQTPGISQNEIAGLMNLAPSTVTRFIDRLEERGLLQREQAGKISHVCPTAKGQELQPVIVKAWADLYARFVDILGKPAADHLTQDICAANQVFEQRAA